MSQPVIYITQMDADKLRRLLRDSGSSDYRGSEYLKKLQEELDRAIPVKPEQIPPDVITMNSTALLKDLETSEEMSYTLVFPEDSDLNQGKISVLAPIGTGMLGYRVGDTFSWETPGGKRIIRVEKILFQPEASGNYS